ncbi:MAG: BolA family transcriptional regulator [Oceanicaulis sp.]|uniref:BolA family protein n=1 Tax=Glycocaulis sp. TaxID=1969725 RepID=UPI0025C17399|nr:BolA family protein [Glycocaulis sp.]MCC5981022.1 BolA family transcriptional regulator [Oceanicaulis sp.]MCH8520945.1 BolA family transcriptional regulator [Glycocaulis sp.]
MAEMRRVIEDKLKAALQPLELTIIDDSAAHAGHAGSRPGGESHFTVDIVSEAFAGQSRIARHRLVNQALAEELTGPIHALVIRAKAPGE